MRLREVCTVEEQESVAFWEAGNTPFAAFFLGSRRPSARRPDDSDGGPANTAPSRERPAETYLRRPSL